MALTVEELWGYLNHSERQVADRGLAILFDLKLKFGTSGLIGATVRRISSRNDFLRIEAHIEAFRDPEPQRSRWHDEIYRTVVHRYAIERYGPRSGKRPLYLAADGEVEALIQPVSARFDDSVEHIQAHCRSMVAQWELDHRARESNHARMARIGAMMEATQ
jgi:hypothetical protein